MLSTKKNRQDRRVIVPCHTGKDLKMGTLLGMIQDISLNKEEFFQLLQNL